MYNFSANRIKCGKCNTEFDLNKNDGCPLCGFGKGRGYSKSHFDLKENNEFELNNYLKIPDDLELMSAKPLENYQTKSVGSWGMFNSFFPGKAVLRILANILNEKKVKSIALQTLVDKTSEVIKVNDLSKFRGFPKDPEKSNSIGRLVYHFIQTFTDMGFFIINTKKETKNKIWDEPWDNIEITLTKEGLKFAQLNNNIFDNGESSQILTTGEKQWLIDYLKKIDEEGYKEYSILKEVLGFIEQGHNGKDELWNWFETNQIFVDYVKQWSRKTNNSEAFEKQIKNLSPTFASGKLALLRELGIIKSKRNDYSIVGEWKGVEE